MEPLVAPTAKVRAMNHLIPNFLSVQKACGSMVLYIQTVLGNGISEPSTVSNLAKFLQFHQPYIDFPEISGFPFQNATFLR